MAEVSTIKPSLGAKVTGLIPMASVADVQRSIDFYRPLGMEVRGQLKTSSGGLQWAHVACEQVELMFARATEPVVPSRHAVLFYLYSPNLVVLREQLISAGVRVSPITYPEYMPKAKSASRTRTVTLCLSVRLVDRGFADASALFTIGDSCARTQGRLL